MWTKESSCLSAKPLQRSREPPRMAHEAPILLTSSADLWKPAKSMRAALSLRRTIKKLSVLLDDSSP